MKRAHQRKYHFIYKITNKLNGKFYIGMHSTDDLGDGYFGSGKLLHRSINRHGKDFHIMEITEFFDSRQELCAREKEILTEELLSNPLCLNLSKGGTGGNKIEWTDERRAERSAMFKQMERTKAHREKIGKALKGKALTPERKAKISEGMKGFTQSDLSVRKRVEKLKGQSRFVWTILTPENEEIKIPSLKKFCEEMGFNYRSLFNSLLKANPLSSGPAKGWKLISKDQI